MSIKKNHRLKFEDLTKGCRNFQIRSHQRTPSGSRDFKEATKRDALQRLEVELEKLLSSAQQNRKPLLEKEYRGFKNLFSRFLAERKSCPTLVQLRTPP